jgi:hypothetical protein
MRVEQSVEWEMAGETEVLGKNQIQCHSIQHRSRMIWLWIGLSYITAGQDTQLNEFFLSLVPPSKYWGRTSDYVMTASFI